MGELLPYRLYTVTPAGRVVGVFQFECENDDVALGVAQSQLGAEPTELWQLARVVARFAPLGSAPAPSEEASAEPSVAGKIPGAEG